MGQPALGTHWDGHAAAQRERFLKAAVSAEARAYSERFGQYGGQTLTVGQVTHRPNGVSVVDSKLNQSQRPADQASSGRSAMPARACASPT